MILQVSGIGIYLHGFEKRIFPDIQQAVIAGREMGAGRSLSHWIIKTAVNHQPIKMLIISTELFSVLTENGWSFALRIA